jgi:hypothetical protein
MARFLGRVAPETRQGLLAIVARMKAEEEIEAVISAGLSCPCC